MKTHTFFLVLTLAATACSERNTRETTPQGECRIQSSTTTSNSSSSTFNEQTTYDYDASGNLLKKTTASQTRFLNPQIAKLNNRDQTTTERYTYDAQGYLLTFSRQFRANYVAPDGQPAIDEFSSSQTYTYTNGRLASYTRQDVNNGKATMAGTLTYEYDAADNLLRVTSGSTPNANNIWTFNQNQLVDYVEKVGNTETRPYVIEKGLVTSYTIPGGWRGVYTYDGQRHLTKMEEYQNNRLTSYYTQTYGEGKPETATVPPFKGFPAVGSPNALPSNNLLFFGQTGLLTGKKQYYMNSLNGSEQFFSETTFVNQLNAQGFVVSTTKQVVFKNSQSPPESTTTTYTYTGCN